MFSNPAWFLVFSGLAFYALAWTFIRKPRPEAYGVQYVMAFIYFVVGTLILFGAWQWSH